MGNTCINCGAIISSGSLACASCGAPQRQIPKPTPQKGGTSPGGFCGSCGTRLTSKYSPCPNCGHVKTMYNPKPDPGNPNPYPGNPNPLPPPQQQGGLYKNPTTALILSLILGFLGICGIGQFYLGKVGRGAVILVVGIILAVLVFGTSFWGALAFLPFWIWQAYDTHQLCKEYNNFVSQNGRAPW